MNIDDRRFIRRHLPSYVPAHAWPRSLAGVGELLALRHDGVLFYRPKGRLRSEVWVGWLERTEAGLALKEKPGTRRLCTYAEYEAEMDARREEAETLLGQSVMGGLGR